LEELEPALGPIRSSISTAQFLRSQRQRAVIAGGNGGANFKSKKGGVMKKFEFLDPARVTLVIALAVGLGIAVHKVFLLIAFVIAIIALGQSVFHAITVHIHRSKLVHRQP
jgi:hypothetical protein